MKYPNIVKDIYRQDGVRRKLRHLPAAYWCSLAGVISTVLLLLYNNLGDGLNALLTMVTAIGVSSLLIIVLFYLIGDKYVVYHTDTNSRLDFAEYCYSAKLYDELKGALQQHDLNKLRRLKKATTPELVLYTYSNDDNNICFAQLQCDYHGKMVAASPIYRLQGEQSSVNS